MKMENTSIIKMQSVPELDEYEVEQIKKQRLGIAGDGKGRKFKESFQSPIIKNPNIAYPGGQN